MAAGRVATSAAAHATAHATACATAYGAARVAARASAHATARATARHSVTTNLQPEASGGMVAVSGLCQLLEWPEHAVKANWQAEGARHTCSKLQPC